MDFKEILDDAIELLKQRDSTPDKVPEFTPVYKDSVEYEERISVHSEIGEFPHVLFKKRAPNQTEEEFAYIKENHKTITFPIWSRFIGVLNRIWSDQNWAISWPQGSEDLQNYLSNYVPKYDNYESYFKNIITPLKQRDANALLCIKPYEIPLKKDVKGNPLVDEKGNAYIDDQQLISPYPYIVESEDVIAYSSGQYALVVLEEKSVVKYGNGTLKCGVIMEFYDKNTIYKIVQVGKKTDWEFQIGVYWTHNLGYLPAWKLKGIPLLKGNDILYQPHFMCAIESLDSALLDNSYLMAIKAGAAFPHKWEYVNECEYTDGDSSCSNGKIYKDGNMTNCPSCGGSGNHKPSVLGVYQIKMPSRTDDSAKGLQLPPFGWESPKFDPMAFLRSEIELHKNESLSILNLQNSTTNAQGGDTALGKIIDREELFSFILSISNQLFELFEISGKAIAQMRYGPAIVLPSISYPKNFSIRNENDITAEIAQAKTAGAPDIAIRALLVEYMNIRFNTDLNTTKITDIVFVADKIITLSSAEIAQKILSGTVAKWQDILHTSIYSLISESMQEDPGFFDLEMNEKVTLLENKAKEMLLEISPKIDSTQSILDASAASGGGQSDDIAIEEAKAKAGLKGSVGGVQGILAIQASVSAGTTDYDAAVETTARKILGNPVDLKPTNDVVK